ncbi:S1 RNA-binding domain-containing protein [Streptomyces sp. NPDC060205]|uniref:S1 RNA-binding domain-containing protein n=2 Tax=Streptomyces TaxID=1883 RepID=UPI0036565BEC
MVQQARPERVETGDVLRGTVSDVEVFGVFVDLGGYEGFIDRLEVSWKRIEDLSLFLRVGQEITVFVLNASTERRPMALSLKALEPDPMRAFARDKLGREVSGTVTEISPIGTFVQVSPDLVGLIARSGGDGDSGTSRKEPLVGDGVTVTVLGVNVNRRRISLSLSEEEGRGRDEERD